MHKLKKYWQHVEHDEAKILKMEEVACEALEKLRWNCPDIFWNTAYELHKIAYGANFDEELAKMAESYKMEVEKLKEFMGENEKKQMKEDLAVQEAVTFLVENAVEK